MTKPPKAAPTVVKLYRVGLDGYGRDQELVVHEVDADETPKTYRLHPPVGSRHATAYRATLRREEVAQGRGGWATSRGEAVRLYAAKAERAAKRAEEELDQADAYLARAYAFARAEGVDLPK